jgi:hypothetical protein
MVSRSAKFNAEFETVEKLQKSSHKKMYRPKTFAHINVS